MFFLLFSLDSIQIFSIPIPWIAVVFITVVSSTRLINHQLDSEVKFVVILFVLLFIPNISSFLHHDTYDQFFSEYTSLRLLNFFSFFVCFLFIAKSNINIEKTTNIIAFLVLVFSAVGVLIYLGQLFDFFDILRNRAGTGIYGQEEQVTFWLSENHRAMSTFREPIFFSSFLLPLTFLALTAESKLSYLVAIFAGYIIGLTRSDLLFFVVLLFLLLFILTFVTNNIAIKKNLPLVVFIVFSFIGYSSTVRECDVNKFGENCPILFDSEPPIWTSDPVSFSRVSTEFFDILWGNATDNVEVVSYKVLINGVSYIEVPAQGDKFTSYRITFNQVEPNSTYNIEIIAGDESGNWSSANPTNSISIGDDSGLVTPTNIELTDEKRFPQPVQDNGFSYIDRLGVLLGEERINIFNYIQDTSFSFNGVGIVNANYEYTKYFSNKNLIANYLTIRTSPKYMSTRYKSQPFGTGETYYLYGSINLQNLLIFNYIAHGAIFLILIVTLISAQINTFLHRSRYFSYVMLCTFSVLIGVFEELSSFQGIILGIIYSIYKDKENIE